MTPNTHRLRLAILGTLALATSLAACVPAQMRIPDGFSPRAVAYDVDGHSPRREGQPLQFGPYTAAAVRDGTTFSWAVPVGSLDVGRTARRYAFILLAQGQAPVEVQCRARTWAIGHDEVNGSVETRIEIDVTGLAGPMLACGLRMPDSGVLPLELSRNGTHVDGRLLGPHGEYAVRSVHGFEGSIVPAAVANGFAIERGGRPIVLVDRLNAGRVHVATELAEDERAWLAAAAAALLLLDDELEV